MSLPQQSGPSTTMKWPFIRYGNFDIHSSRRGLRDGGFSLFLLLAIFFFLVGVYGSVDVVDEHGLWSVHPVVDRGLRSTIALTVIVATAHRNERDDGSDDYQRQNNLSEGRVADVVDFVFDKARAWNDHVVAWARPAFARDSGLRELVLLVERRPAFPEQILTIESELAAYHLVYVCLNRTVDGD